MEFSELIKVVLEITNLSLRFHNKVIVHSVHTHSKRKTFRVKILRTEQKFQFFLFSNNVYSIVPMFKKLKCEHS